MCTVAVFPGRFHPFSLGHKGVYDHLLDNADVKIDDVYVATSAKQNSTDSPFNIDDKKTMMVKTGVPPGRIIEVTNPYKIDEIIERLGLDPAQDRLIYALGSDDAKRFKYTADTPLQLWTKGTKMQPVGKHAYVKVIPQIAYNILGKKITHASDIRKMYLAGNDNERNQIITDLYGSPDPAIKDIFDRSLGVDQPAEGIIYGQERVYAGEQEASIMREERLACLRENIEFLKQKLLLLRENQDTDDDIDMSGNYAMSPQGYRSMRRKQIAWAKKPASESPTARFAYQGFVIQFHPDRVEIYHGGDMVYNKSGNFSNPTTQQLSTIKGRIPALVAKLKQSMSEDYIDEKWTRKYKKSINCSNPRGFSQKAHCAARRKRARGQSTKSKPV